MLSVIKSHSTETLCTFSRYLSCKKISVSHLFLLQRCNRKWRRERTTEKIFLLPLRSDSLNQLLDISLTCFMRKNRSSSAMLKSETFSTKTIEQIVSKSFDRICDIHSPLEIIHLLKKKNLNTIDEVSNLIRNHLELTS
jgi:hypothetical protein